MRVRALTADAPPQRAPLRVAFVGAGAMANVHLGALARVATPHAVVGVQDVDPAKAQEFAARAQARAYPDLAGLLRQAEPHVVHVCTPAGTHFDPARQALLAGAHVYVEKPFAESKEEAEALLRLAQEQERVVCAGHQLVRDRAFLQLLGRGADLGPVVLIDSCFAFRPPQLALHRAGPRECARQLLDVLPHPLYTLVAAAERLASAPPVLASACATPSELHALFRAGNVWARLFVSLQARPVASTLAITGVRGTLTADFVRGIVLGAGNEGTAPLEKIANPFLEGAQLVWRTASSLGRRLVRGESYPGLAELIEAFYHAAATGEAPPLPGDHLRRVATCYEELAAEVWRAADRSARRPAAEPAPHARGGPLAVVTGASGFLGREITRELAARGFRIRGLGRRAESPDPSLDEWICLDLSRDAPVDALAGAQVVVHAAAETTGGFEAHQRNTVDATRNLLRGMQLAGVGRLVHVSSLSVLRPPRTFWEHQDERTPVAVGAEQLGAYTWGKCVSEGLVTEAHREGRIVARILRPAALIDRQHPELPGLVGRRLFGPWHLGFGRPSLPIAVAEVQDTGAAIAWCAEQFAEAPAVVNLIDGAIRTRGELLAWFRARGWRGRMIWVPIPLLAGVLTSLRALRALARFQLPKRLAVWGVLRPRRYDTTVAAAVLGATAAPSAPATATEHPVASPGR